MKRYPAWGRVSFIHPGKHGMNDLRVEFNGSAPTLAEMLTLVWGHFRAEDRYADPHQEGRGMLKRLIDELYRARTWAEARPTVERCDSSIQERRAA